MRQAGILLVEDDALIRMMIADMLEELGHHVVAEAGQLDEARALARTAAFDIALLDVNLDGETITPAKRSSLRRRDCAAGGRCSATFSLWMLMDRHSDQFPMILQHLKVFRKRSQASLCHGPVVSINTFLERISFCEAHLCYLSHGSDKS